MDYKDKIVLGQLRNEESLEHAIEVFERNGFDMNQTVSDAITAYRRQNGFGTGAIADDREDMHDLMHILINRVNGTIEDEAHAAIAEMVFLRGPYDTYTDERRNIYGHERIGLPAAIPEFDQALALARQREAKLNGFHGTSVKTPEDELRQTYDQAREKDYFIKMVTNGRIIDDFTTRDTPDVFLTIQEMPLPLLGVTQSTSSAGLEFTDIRESMRESLIAQIQKDPPHKTQVWDLESDDRFGTALYQPPNDDAPGM